MAPERRSDLARLSGRALLGGFLATVINACVASMLI
jgi:nucleoside permease NupC